MSRSRNILLLGSNGHAGLACCRSLGRAGHRVTILRLTPQRSLADHSRFCSESLFIGSPDSGVHDYVAKLADLLGSRHFDYVIPVDDLSSELIYSEYDAISSRVRVAGPGTASYALAHDRFAILKLAESAGLKRPETILAKRGELPPVPSLPCLVRPIYSSSIIDDEPQTFSDRKVHTPDELDAKLRDDLPRVDVMLQVPVTGASVGLNFCAVDGKVLGAAVTLHRKTDEVSPQTLAGIENVARQLSWTGFMTMECRKTKDSLFLLEVIGRPWDSISLPIFAGVDLPVLLIDGLEGIDPSSIALPTRTVFTRALQRDIGWLADPLPAVRRWDRSIKALGNRIKRRLSPLRAQPHLAGSLQKTSSLLVVCQGNINRSVVAEHFLKARGFTAVRSAGLLNMSGRRPSKLAEAFLTERLGIDASKLRSQSVTRALRDTDDIDLVVCFERKHEAEIVRRFPKLRGKVILLSELASRAEGPPEIADPHGAAVDVYLACFRRIEKLVGQL